MTNQRIAENYLARARELEDCAQREEQHPSSIHLSPRWRDAAFLHHEALRWRAYAEAIAKKQPD